MLSATISYCMATTLTPGDWYMIKHEPTNKCISADYPISVALLPCDSKSDNQLYRFQKVSENVYQIFGKNQKALQYNGESSLLNMSSNKWTEWRTKWTAISSGNGFIFRYDEGNLNFCIDATHVNGLTASKICDKSTNQVWLLASRQNNPITTITTTSTTFTASTTPPPPPASNTTPAPPASASGKKCTPKGLTKNLRRY